MQAWLRSEIAIRLLQRRVGSSKLFCQLCKLGRCAKGGSPRKLAGRYWVAATYEERHSKGQEPQNIDKEFLRLWFRSHCDPYKDKVPALQVNGVNPKSVPVHGTVLITICQGLSPRPQPQAAAAAASIGRFTSIALRLCCTSQGSAAARRGLASEEALAACPDTSATRAGTAAACMLEAHREASLGPSQLL